MVDIISSVLTSTNYDPTFNPNALIRSYEVLFPDGHIEDYLDYADWNYRAILKGISIYNPVKYNGYEKFTTLVNRYYNTTTVYRIVLTFSGYMHPYEIPAGGIIKLPDATQLFTLINNQLQKKQASPVQDVII